MGERQGQPREGERGHIQEEGREGKWTYKLGFLSHFTSEKMEAQKGYKKIVQGLPASEGQSRDVNPGSFTPKSRLRPRNREGNQPTVSIPPAALC